MNATHSNWGEIFPGRDEFVDLAATRRVVPVAVTLLIDDTSPASIYRRLAAGRPGSFILESAEQDYWSNWSFVGVSSSAFLTARDGQAQWEGDVPEGLRIEGSATELLADALETLASAHIDGMPPLTGGLVGVLGWDILYDWEPTLRKKAPAEHTVPDVAMCLTEELVAIDHRRGVVWLIANAINRNGLPDGVEAAYDRAIGKIGEMMAALTGPQAARVLQAGDQAPAQPRMRVTPEQFQDAVRAGQQHIVDGDVFQVVLSQRADIPCTADPLDVYLVLRSINPSPYMYYLNLRDGDDSFSVVGSSPETLMAVRDGTVRTFPIAGSRPRGATPIEDREMAEELLKDPKEISEHVMLVDLSRNDLAKVSKPGTVDVSEFMSIARFSHIMHITSTVTGELRDGVNAVEALAATFPAGTLSGAPKTRAIEIIDELEPARRGIYGGVAGYFDFAGNADVAIAIRTAVLADGMASVQSGAGIVADSVPETEDIETRNKAAAAVRAIQIAQTLVSPLDAFEDTSPQEG
ncbi:chorismate-binding protein [Flaviflexus equikiangi]|uniref:Anthranilate synthase component 1 n=1 Tax=Flaviflexus equikiangi TaxID=2758573 RepID=A0ABS2THE9_9ACTO|nr:chorismate-binding protein [Flaviflexus equikiangi]MBM9434071.1 chorismate-binding protein [Flaviflexus equikiangi]